MSRLETTGTAPRGQEQPLRFLHLEDDPRDGELIRASLRGSGLEFTLFAVRTRQEFERALADGAYHVILSDYSLPGFDGAAALALARARQPDAAFIFVSGTIGEERAVESMKSGATDYVLKSHLDRLASVVRRALREVAARGEKDRAEQALHQSQVLLRLAMQASSIGSWDWDLLTGEVRVSSEWKAQLGYPDTDPADSIASWMDRVHPEDRARVEALAETTRRDPAARYDIEYRLRHGDGSYRWIHSKGMVLRDPEGRPVRMLGCHLDISDRKLSEQRLQEQAALLDAASDAIYVYDLEETLLYWNRAAERLYGWTGAEVVGQSFTRLLSQEPAANRAVHDALLGHGSWSGEMKMTNRAGSPVVVFATRTLVRDEPGRSARVLAIDVDLSERKRLEAQFLRAQRVEAVGTLASGIAHDLNNILAPILMSVGLLEEEIQTDTGRETLETLRTCSERGADLVKQVLSFARGFTGQRIAINPVHILRDVEKIVRETFPKNITVTLAAPHRPWTVTGDPTQLHQIFMNLCVNARDAMPDGGRLSISAENATFDEVYSSMTSDARPGPYIVITIADTGTGIPPEIRERIFEPFFTTKAVGQGTGLGLSTSVTIVRSHGGFIDLATEPGRGTAFRVCLPANPTLTVDALPSGHGTRKGLPRGNGELILVVDDEESIRKIARETLELFGFRVLLAANGAEAVALYAAQRSEIAAVLTDMAMPVMDGSSTIVALRAIDPQVRIIASSGLNENATKAGAAGVRHVILKPYTAETLVATLGRVLRGK